MIDVKFTPKEGKENTAEAAEMVAPSYPWGLSISLYNDSLEKLGLTDKKFSVGDEMTIECVVKVSGVSEDETINDGTRKRVGLQITEMGVKTDTEEDKQAKGIYKKG